LKCRGGQPVAGIDRLVTPFGEIDVIASPLDPHPPLRADLALALFQAGALPARVRSSPA
jgi:hypothetical protein